MSEQLFVPSVVTEAGLTVSRYAGPETDSGQTRVRVQLTTDEGSVTTFSIDQWLALSAAVNRTAWESRDLPICYMSTCQHARPPHGRWADCPEPDRG